MQLTRYSDYSLRTLMYLALKPDEKVNISDIARTFNISRNHLVKIVHHLGQLGYIHTVRGRGGGIQLGAEAEDINVGKLVRATEQNLQVVDCWEPACPLVTACLLKGALHEATDAFLSVLDSYTLADLVKQKARLHKLIA